MKQNDEIKQTRVDTTQEEKFAPRRSYKDAASKRTGKTAGRTNRRRHGRLTKRDLLIMLIPAVAAIAAVVVVLITTDRGSSFQMAEAGKQYYAGSSAAIHQEMELKIDEEGKVTFADENLSSNAEVTLPIYYDNSRTVVLTIDMLYYMPRSDTYTRVSALSEVNCAENGMINVNRDGKNAKPEAGFLYDGKDFYLFLEPVTVNYMGYTTQLPALSYAEVRNGGDIMLFNYETKEFTIETLSGIVTAATAYGDYTISLLGDSMTNFDGELTLLMTKPREIDPLV